LSADAHRRAPGAGAGGSVDEQVAETFQAVGEFTEDAGGKPGEGKNLAAMSVPGELEANSLLFDDGETVRNVGEEDASAGGIELGIFENGLEAARVGGFVERNAKDLEAIEINSFIVKDVDAGTLDGVQIVGGVGEFFVIAGDEVGAESRSKRFPGSGEAVIVDASAIEHVAGNKDDVGAKMAESGDESTEEAAADDMAEVGVGDEGGGAPTPGSGKAGEFDGDAMDADVGCIEDAVKAREKSEREEAGGDLKASDGEMEELDEGENEPGGNGGEEGKIKNAKPGGGEFVVEANRAVEIAMGEKRGWDEGDGEEEEHCGERGGRDGVVAGEEVGERFVDESVKDEEEQLDDSDEARDAGDGEGLGLWQGRVGGGHTFIGCGIWTRGEMEEKRTESGKVEQWNSKGLKRRGER